MRLYNFYLSSAEIAAYNNRAAIPDIATGVRLCSRQLCENFTGTVTRDWVMKVQNMVLVKLTKFFEYRYNVENIQNK